MNGDETGNILPFPSQRSDHERFEKLRKVMIIGWQQWLQDSRPSKDLVDYEIDATLNAMRQMVALMRGADR